jgi:hypothetical protein
VKQQKETARNNFVPIFEWYDHIPIGDDAHQGLAEMGQSFRSVKAKATLLRRLADRPTG